jgi:hypothetical protein
MICYRDRTFCPFWEECKDGKDCTRALTPKVYEDAKKWWGFFKTEGDPPIAYWAEKPECFKDKGETDEV